jgi:hypothetical protein
MWKFNSLVLILACSACVEVPPGDSLDSTVAPSETLDGAVDVVGVNQWSSNKLAQPLSACISGSGEFATAHETMGSRLWGVHQDSLLMSGQDHSLEWWQSVASGPEKTWGDEEQHISAVGWSKSAEELVAFDAAGRQFIHFDPIDGAVLREIPSLHSYPSNIAVSGDGTRAIPTQEWFGQSGFEIVDLETAEISKIDFRNDGVTAAKFIGEDDFVIGGTRNFSELYLERRDINDPEEILARWTTGSRRCGGGDSVTHIELTEGGDTLVVAGRTMWGNRFLVVLDAHDLTEKVAEFTLTHNFEDLAVLTDDVIATVGDDVQFWNLNDLSHLGSLVTDGYSYQIDVKDNTLVVVEGTGTVQAIECRPKGL